MDYEKRYKEANDKVAARFGTNVAKEIFADLYGSEDEKIRKELINYFKYGVLTPEHPERKLIESWIAWPEKQDKKNPADKVEPKIKIEKDKWYVCNTARYTDFIVGKVYYCPKNGMLKPNENEIARYVASNCFHLWTIQDAKDGDVLVCESGERTLGCLFIFKLIADREVHEYCSYRTIDKHFSLKDSFLGYVDNVYHPATKEQRDILFSKMKEAGYEWDFDKKELRKIDDYCKENCKGFQETGKCYADGKCKAKREVEQKPADETPYPENLEKAIDLYYYSYGNGEGEFEHLSLEKFRDIVHTFVSDYGQKPAWSEEDENIINDLTQTISQYTVFAHREPKEIIQWLKSLKQHWKPNDEQMQSLYFAIITYSKKDDCKLTYDSLNSLYNDLKKL